jgi:hypothetical protein
MEGLTRLVTESLARHGFDRPLDYRRLQWSRWFRCESHHSLLFVPSKPGVFAVAEEVIDFGTPDAHMATDAFVRPVSGPVPSGPAATDRPWSSVANHQFTAAHPSEAESRKPEAAKRMLAVTQFFEDDDMAFVLDRMLSRQNVMSSRLASGRYFVRFVVVEDQTQRRSICAALNQWIVSASEKATGIASEFATSLELTPATEYIPQPDDRQQLLFADATISRVGRTLLSADTTAAHTGTDAFVRPATLSDEKGSAAITKPAATTLSMTAPQLDSGAATNIHCPSPLPSGF